VSADSKLSLTQQANNLGIARQSLYYQPVVISQKEIDIKNQVDEIYTKCPFYGYRKITNELVKTRKEAINHKRVARYMREIGLQAIYPGPKTSTPNPQHQIFPYLLRNITANFPNHIWGTDITYIRMPHGFVYLVAFMDWFSRFVLSWQISTSLEDEFVIEAAKQALNMYGNPDYSNQDQGSQFTSNDYIAVWDQDHTKISMDGRGRCMDNIFTERLWRTVKYEEVYLKSYETPAEAVANIGAYFEFYNYQRSHQSLGYKTPADVYFKERNVS
jgi:putative transposase